MTRSAAFALLALGLAGCAAEPAPEAPPTVAVVEIPPAMQGRWGLDPADCTADPAVAKGLMEVGPTGLRFYESRAVLRDGRLTGPVRLEGLFDFEGEGQEWTLPQVLDLRLDGAMLVRREPGPAERPLFYHACPPV